MPITRPVRRPLSTLLPRRPGLPHPSLGLVTVTTSPAITTIASAIQTQEGYAPGTTSYTNNNPGNLMYAGQPGAVQGAGGFAVFPTYDSGYQALLRQIQLDANNGMSISSMMNSWAPAYDANGSPIPGNNPTLYANNVAAALGVDPSTSVSSVFAGAPITDTSGTSYSTIGTDPDPDSTDDSSTGTFTLDSSTIDWSSILLVGGVVGLGLLLLQRR